jgi:hypothetical protein
MFIISSNDEEYFYITYFCMVTNSVIYACGDRTYYTWSKDISSIKSEDVSHIINDAVYKNPTRNIKVVPV